MRGHLPLSTAHLAAAAVTAGLLSAAPSPAQASAAASTAATATPSAGQRWPGHRDRVLVRHVVRAGDTAGALAVRYHAWTDELISLNRLGTRGALRLGQTLRIPIVVSAARTAGQKVPGVRSRQAPKQAPAKPAALLIHAGTPPKGWRHADLPREQVRALVIGMARHYGVPPRLALSIAWQESGWQQRRVSSAGALGVMQVMPDTGRWMRAYAGRQLRLRDTHDNIQAGVLTLRTLLSWTKRDTTAIEAYYQGLGSVREIGRFQDTKSYVRSVLAHRDRIARTGRPR